MDRTITEAVLAPQSRWIEAEQAGRPEGLLALCTDDIVMQGPGLAPRVGKEAVRPPLPDRAGDLNVRLSDVEIAGDGLLVVKTARFRTGMPDGSVVTGRHVWIIRPAWKVCAVSWVLDEVPPR